MREAVSISSDGISLKRYFQNSGHLFIGDVLLLLPLCSPVLEPDLHLLLRHCQQPGTKIFKKILFEKNIQENIC